MQAVVAVALYLVHGYAVHDELEEADGQAGDADEADFAGFLDLAQGGDGLGDDMVEVAEFHVVALDEVDVVHAEAGEAGVHIARHAAGGEIELDGGLAVAGDLGGEDVAIARRP